MTRFDVPAGVAAAGPRAVSSMVLFAAVLVAPVIFADDFVLRFFAEVLIFGIAVMSLDILVGFGAGSFRSAMPPCSAARPMRRHCSRTTSEAISS